MLKSMTGFAESSAEAEGVRVWVRINSVNSRFLDLSIKLPSVLNSLEPDVIKFINERVTRGKVSLYAWIEGQNKAIVYQPILDRKLLMAYAEVLEEAAGILWGEPRVSLGELVDLEIVTLKEKEEGKEILKTLFFSALRSAFEKFDGAKRREGKYLASEIRRRIRLINEKIKALKKLKLKQANQLRAEWENNLKELLQNRVDESLVVREASQMILKKDFTEELVRLEGHIDFLRESLNECPPCGSRLAFILQEGVREITTLSAKADNKEIARLSVFIKEELERIREQVQNIE